jgi:anion-transporting  ArsA/GET3 family ATPase
VRGLRDELNGADVIVCCGPGGVGKTTASATLALELAESGKHVVVLTVDPARRLADALGIKQAGADPVLVPGIEHGTLHALMLDAEGTFDQLIDRYATSPEQAESITSNRLYKSLVSALSGTQEFMAMEKLYELCESARFDVVVVDTPPTRNALDLLDAPRRLTSFLENRIFRALLAPTRLYLRAVSVATRAVLSTIGSVAGAELVDDAVTFFQAFAGMEEGFVQRAGAVHDRLRAPGTAFVLVTSPKSDAIEEARFFADRLVETGLSTAGVIVNRVHPTFFTDEVPAAVRSAEGDLGALVANLESLRAVASTEQAALADLAASVAPAPLATIPLRSDEIHDVAGLRRLAAHLEDRVEPTSAAG